MLVVLVGVVGCDSSFIAFKMYNNVYDNPDYDGEPVHLDGQHDGQLLTVESFLILFDFVQTQFRPA